MDDRLFLPDRNRRLSAAMIRYCLVWSLDNDRRFPTTARHRYLARLTPLNKRFMLSTLIGFGWTGGVGCCDATAVGTAERTAFLYLAGPRLPHPPHAMDITSHKKHGQDRQPSRSRASDRNTRLGAVDRPTSYFWYATRRQ